MSGNIIDFESWKNKKNSATDVTQQVVMPFIDERAQSHRKPYDLAENDSKSICLCCTMQNGNSVAVPYSHYTYAELDANHAKITIDFHNIDIHIIIEGKDLEILLHDIAQFKASEITEMPNSEYDKAKWDCWIDKITVVDPFDE